MYIVSFFLARRISRTNFIRLGYLYYDFTMDYLFQNNCTVEQWLVLLLHSKKVLGSNLSQDVSVWSLHIVRVGLLRVPQFPQSKNSLISFSGGRLIGDSRCEWLFVCTSPRLTSRMYQSHEVWSSLYQFKPWPEGGSACPLLLLNQPILIIPKLFHTVTAFSLHLSCH